jgi:hypothetical protein
VRRAVLTDRRAVATVNPPVATVNAPVATVNAPVATVNAPVATVNAPVATVKAPVATEGDEGVRALRRDRRPGRVIRRDLREAGDPLLLQLPASAKPRPGPSASRRTR